MDLRAQEPQKLIGLLFRLASRFTPFNLRRFADASVMAFLTRRDVPTGWHRRLHMGMSMSVIISGKRYRYAQPLPVLGYDPDISAVDWIKCRCGRFAIYTDGMTFMRLRSAKGLTFGAVDLVADDGSVLKQPMLCWT